MNSQQRPLHSCLWELTLRCNMRCLHCGSAAGRARHRELSLDEAFSIVSQLAEMRCAELTFIGGEIFLYPGWHKVSRNAAENGILVNTMTNAWAIGPPQVQQILEARLHNVGISIDGLEQRHDFIRGRPGSFRRILEACNLLREAGVPIAVVTSLLELNYSDLPELYELFLSLGVEIWQIQLVNPMGAMLNRRDLLLQPSRIPALLDFINEKTRERRMTVVAADSVGYYYDNTECAIRGHNQAICFWEGCQAGLTSLFLDSVGNVKGCGALYDDVFIEGNVRERSLADIWNDESKFAYNRAFTPELLTGPCRDCFAAESCKAGCRASNYFNLGTLYENAYCPHAQPVPLEPATVA